MRLGIFGGTFDPVHYGHLLLAECAREQCALDAVWFVPAAISPHKQQRHPAAAEARSEMLRLAIGGQDTFSVYTGEIERGGVSYTVETLERLAAEDASREMFLIMGADSLADLPTWREPTRICELATPAVVSRAGSPLPNFEVLQPLMSPERWELARRSAVEMPLIGLSATEIRRRVAAGKSIRYRTPRAVEMYITTRGLYRNPFASDVYPQ